jgi:hypothetical protein
MSVWELPKDCLEYQIMNEMIEKYHQPLKEAKIVLYGCDKNKVNGNMVRFADTSKASVKMKASIDADFTITLYMMPWGDLTLEQKKACMDHELTHCGVHYEPIKEQVGSSKKGKPRFKVVKDEYGRKQYTNEIKRDENGVPKWKLEPHDLEEFQSVVKTWGLWQSSIKEFKDALNKGDKSENQ